MIAFQYVTRQSITAIIALECLQFLTISKIPRFPAICPPFASLEATTYFSCHPVRIRKIKEFDSEFSSKDFAERAQEIFIEAHNALCTYVIAAEMLPSCYTQSLWDKWRCRHQTSTPVQPAYRSLFCVNRAALCVNKNYRLCVTNCVSNTFMVILVVF